MSTLRLVTDIAARRERVWRALTEPAEVQVWDGAEPLDVAPDYPRPGQHAQWRIAFGPGPNMVLHDRVRSVQPDVCLQSDISYAFVRLDESYVLSGDSPTRLLTLVGVAAQPAVLGPLARRLTYRSVRAAMGRLRAHCESS